MSLTKHYLRAKIFQFYEGNAIYSNTIYSHYDFPALNAQAQQSNIIHIEKIDFELPNTPPFSKKNAYLIENNLPFAV